MGAKRALIVDDSKTARLFLSRILEKYEIVVDSAESAEQAIEYLGSHRPDVIFMDHLMPGMDGFQAVQAIKNNPRTAMIPILMYTSQEGELYLGQARALGAVGVLPKQIRPTDVSKVLSELHLVSERRTAEQPRFTPPTARVGGVPAEAGAALASKPLTDSALREHFAELRRALVAGIDTQTERITGEVRALLREARSRPRERGAPRRAATWVACAALGLALLSAALWGRTVKLLDGLTVQLAQLQHRDAPPFAALAPPGAAVATPGAATPAAEAPTATTPAAEAPTATTPAAAARSAPGAATVIPSDGKPVVVPVPAGDAASVLVPYPPVGSELTAGDWNRAAGANNRIEIRVH